MYYYFDPNGGVLRFDSCDTLSFWMEDDFIKATKDKYDKITNVNIGYYNKTADVQEKDYYKQRLDEGWSKKEFPTYFQG